MANGRGSFASRLRFRGLHPWDLCLVLESSFLCSWIILKNQGRKRVRNPLTIIDDQNVNSRISLSLVNVFF